MKKIKVIDSLNKRAKGEELPKRIYCFDREFYLKENTYFGDTFTLMHYIMEEDLNDVVEIIEDTPKEEKKIPEKLYAISKTGDLTIEYPHNGELMNKINEVIDYLESKGE